MQDLKSGLGPLVATGEMETSLMLAIHPDLVLEIPIDSATTASDASQNTPPASSSFAGWTSGVNRATGVIPLSASAEKGEQMLTAIVDSLEEIVGQILGGTL